MLKFKTCVTCDHEYVDKPHPDSGYVGEMPVLSNDVFLCSFLILYMTTPVYTSNNMQNTNIVIQCYFAHTCSHFYGYLFQDFKTSVLNIVFMMVPGYYFCY